MSEPLSQDRGGARRWSQGSRSILEHALRAGFLHLLVSTVFIQGLAVLVQLVIAHLVGSASFGIVRSVEVVVSIALILGSLGMPTLAIKSIAEVTGGVRAEVLGRLMLLSLAAGVAVALACTFGARLLVPAAAVGYLRALIWVLPISVVARTGLNYFQGVQRFKKMAVVGASLSACSLPLIYVAAARWQLPGWVGGRYLGELCFLAGTLMMVGSRARLGGVAPRVYAYARLARLGLGISVSRLIKTSFDGAAVLMLGWIVKDTRVVGQYGLASLLITGALVLPGTLANLYLPQLASQPLPTGERYATYGQVLKTVFAAMLALALLTVLGAPLVPFVFGASYRPAVPLLMVLSLLLPCRAVASTAGTYLLTIEDIPWMVRTNSLELAAAVAGYAWWIPRDGMFGAAWATVVAEVILTVLYVRRCRSCNTRLQVQVVAA